MKKATALLSLTVFTLIVPTSFTFALARAPFPSASKLQPIPVFTHPNVSGNVNSSDPVAIPQVNEDASSNVGSDMQQPQDDVSLQKDQAPHVSSSSVNPVTILLLISPTLLIIAGALAIKRRADKNKLV